MGPSFVVAPRLISEKSFFGVQVMGPLMSQFRLEGKTALVTGGSKGLGLAMARHGLTRSVDQAELEFPGQPLAGIDASRMSHGYAAAARLTPVLQSAACIVPSACWPSFR